MKESNLTPEGLLKDSPEANELVAKRDFLSKAKESLRYAIDSRRRYDYEWMVRDLFRRGYHFSRYQPSTQTIVLASRQAAKVPVNIVTAQMRSIRNQATSFKPKYETIPRYTTEESRTQARYIGKFLDYLWEHLNLKKRVKETVTQGLMYSIGGPWEIYYDDIKKEVRIWLLDPFDFYIDPLAEELEDAEYVIKATRRPLTEVTSNPDYNRWSKREIHSGESRLAVSEYKQFMIQSLKTLSPSMEEMNASIILFEGYFKIRNEKGKVHIRKIVWTDQNFTPLVYEDLEQDYFDFALYQADLNPKEIMGEGWMKHVIPINRVIDSLESSTFEYNYRVAKGRIVVDRDSGVRAIHNVHGEIISKNRGAEVRALDMPPLPIAVGNQIERMNRYIEDIGAVHEASLGRVPSGVKYGIGIAELKQSDSTNQNDIVDNLEDFLVEVAYKLLKKVSKHYSNYKVVQVLGHRESEAQYFAVVGSQSGKKGNKSDVKHKNQVKIGPDWLDLAIIGEDNNVRVTIGSWLGYSKEAMQDKVLKLAQLGLIDQKTFLKLWEFGDIDTIVQQSRIESLLKRKIEQGMGGEGSPGEEDQYGLALTENEMMAIEGKKAVVDAHDDHLVHIALHQEAIGRGNDDLVRAHLAEHQTYVEQNYPFTDTSKMPELQPERPVPTPDVAMEVAMQQPTAQQPIMGGQPTPAQINIPPQAINNLMGT